MSLTTQEAILVLFEAQKTACGLAQIDKEGMQKWMCSQGQWNRDLVTRIDALTAHVEDLSMAVKQLQDWTLIPGDKS